MNNIIQIGLTASVEINYIKLLINSLILLADNPNNLEFIIGVDIGKGKGNVNLSDLMQHKIVKYDTKLPYSSMAHGLLMDYLLHNHFDKKFGMIIDSDVCFLRKGWDTDFISEITKSNLIYLGTENVNKDRKFPGPYCMFFQTKEIQNMNYSTMPVQSVYYEKKYDFGEQFESKMKEDYRNIINGNNFKITKNADIYELKNGDEMVFDTGSQFNIFFKNKKDKYKILPRKRPSDEDLIFLHKNGKGQEFYLNGKVYLTHQGRCRNSWNKDERNILWLKQIKDWFSKDDLTILFKNIK